MEDYSRSSILILLAALLTFASLVTSFKLTPLALVSDVAIEAPSLQADAVNTLSLTTQSAQVGELHYEKNGHIINSLSATPHTTLAMLESSSVEVTLFAGGFTEVLFTKFMVPHESAAVIDALMSYKVASRQQVEIELEIDGVAVCSQLQDINEAYTIVRPLGCVWGGTLSQGLHTFKISGKGVGTAGGIVDGEDIMNYITLYGLPTASGAIANYFSDVLPNTSAGSETPFTTSTKEVEYIALSVGSAYFDGYTWDFFSVKMDGLSNDSSGGHRRNTASKQYFPFSNIATVSPATVHTLTMTDLDKGAVVHNLRAAVLFIPTSLGSLVHVPFMNPFSGTTKSGVLNSTDTSRTYFTAFNCRTSIKSPAVDIGTSNTKVAFFNIAGETKLSTPFNERSHSTDDFEFYSPLHLAFKQYYNPDVTIGPLCANIAISTPHHLTF